jgi:hypothetical protein
MNATIVAAIIAASVSAVTLIGTLIAQYVGRRATSRELDRTFNEQRTRTLNERFATAADRLGGDKPPAVQLAGVYAMAVLADDWEKNRQTCVDVLCAYLRMPYEPDPGADASAEEQRAYRASREVRHTVIRVITAHLKEDAAVSWQGLNFDFTGVVFDGGDFLGAKFTGGKVWFSRAKFSGGEVNFGAEFSGGEVDFRQAEFCGGRVNFFGAEFSDSWVNFYRAKFSGGRVDFYNAEFSGGLVIFTEATFSGGEVFFRARFTGSQVDFLGAKFIGATVDFKSSRFAGSKVTFSGVADWSSPPAFPWTDTPPPGVTLLEKEDGSQAQGSAD